ncbi:hypothetical protein BJ875DRAFT_95257 [Amylocarpus encephaloides]|uniref:Uncharacterized protein n=1 Tax=Amylocarpus encephaloides TaxID=45428 RepID=A0A9P7YQZ2_9HELO|nr:hypothetical protein BJ875DRAFT_95257 [Amylocarpus encephaloides]
MARFTLLLASLLVTFTLALPISISLPFLPREASPAPVPALGVGGTPNFASGFGLKGGSATRDTTSAPVLVPVIETRESNVDVGGSPTFAPGFGLKGGTATRDVAAVVEGEEEIVETRALGVGGTPHFATGFGLKGGSAARDATPEATPEENVVVF